MTFSEKTRNFLSENFSNNSRDWYKEHKREYQEFVAEPFASFIMKLEPTLHAIDPGISVDPRHFSRLFRDMRFVAGGPIFHENVWCAFAREPNAYTELPCFYFDLSPNGYEYGFGFYRAPAKTMESIRGLITDGDKGYLTARQAYEKQHIFIMGGDIYKKDRFPQAAPCDAVWLNHRSIYFYAREDFSDTLFQEEFADQIARQFLLLEPIYQFFLRACERVQ